MSNEFDRTDFRTTFVGVHDSKWKNFCRHGQKVEAIKEVRMIYGYGLKEAKDLVEAWWNWERLVNKAEPTFSRTIAGRRFVVTQHNDGTFTVIQESKIPDVGGLINFFLNQQSVEH